MEKGQKQINKTDRTWNVTSLHSFQTNIGSILAAVNPYKQIPGLYDLERVHLYSKHHLGELPPHIFAVANECYRCIWKRHDSQCVLIRLVSTTEEAMLIKYTNVALNHALSIDQSVSQTINPSVSILFLNPVSQQGSQPIPACSSWEGSSVFKNNTYCPTLLPHSYTCIFYLSECSLPYSFSLSRVRWEDHLSLPDS